MCSNSAPAAYRVCRGPGTLETVMLAARRNTPEASASTTSLSLPPESLASALARDSEIETPAKLRSDEIDLFRMVGGEAMLARLSRDFGSETLPITSETLLSMVGMLPAK